MPAIACSGLTGKAGLAGISQWAVTVAERGRCERWSLAGMDAGETAHGWQCSTGSADKRNRRFSRGTSPGVAPSGRALG
jgi:hypothetical protein